MKQHIIKRLAEAIQQVLTQNAISNDMAFLVDCGEWSQTSPDFSDVVLRYKLDRNLLKDYIKVAEHNKHVTDIMNVYKNRATYLRKNHWREICETLHCIFIAGYLQQQYDVLSPDGFSINAVKTYNSYDEAHKEMHKWLKGICDFQGYYSYRTQQLNFVEALSMCKIIKV